MTLSPSDWHLRYQEQARWTASLREYLFQLADLSHTSRVLEVGCGTGAILSEMESRSLASITGADINFTSLAFSRQSLQRSLLVCADAHQLPYASDLFDLVVAHFLLLWVRNPIQVVAEMLRVTRSGGSVLVLAEPDYGGRIDYPDPLAAIGDWQIAALRQQGADPRLGRRLAAIFAAAGVVQVQVGVLGGLWSPANDQTEMMRSEWQVIHSDISNLPVPPSPDLLDRLQELDQSARQRGERILYVPTFYAWGKKPG